MLKVAASYRKTRQSKSPNPAGIPGRMFFFSGGAGKPAPARAFPPLARGAEMRHTGAMTGIPARRGFVPVTGDSG